MPYRIGSSLQYLSHVKTNTFLEISPNNRAFCKATDCVGKVKIQKGEFRQATMVTIKEHQSWAYRHW
jgi:hypothetical protein